MKPEEFQLAAPIGALTEKIRRLSAGKEEIRLMHLCGSHEHSLNQHALRQLLPENLRVIPGPGCPVCVCPAEEIDRAIHLSSQEGITLLTFGDMLKVPGSRESLAEAKSRGGSVRMVYSPFDALKLAREKPAERFVFFAVGFETTMAGVAGLLLQPLPENLFFLVAGRYVPPATRLLMRVHERKLDGFILPGHACIITGLEPYRFLWEDYAIPGVVAGFEAADVLLGIEQLLEEIEEPTTGLRNAYGRAVRDEGNQAAQGMIERVFELRSGIWRGIEAVEASAFVLREEFARRDAKLALPAQPDFPPREHPAGCICHRVMLGERLPTDCVHFQGNCNEQNPIGPCMVSTEGTCNSWLRFGVNEL